MRVAIYARISTDETRQNPETQLIPLREFCKTSGYEVYEEFVDDAPAQDWLHRTAWRLMVELASQRKFDLILIWRLDRAFRSVIDAANTLERLRSWKVGLRSYTESWIDTTTPFGEALYYITAAYAQLEKAIIVERVKAGMDRAKTTGTRSGKPIGRKPSTITVREVYDALVSEKNIILAAKELKCSRGYIYKVCKEYETNPLAIIRGEWKLPEEA